MPLQIRSVSSSYTLPYYEKDDVLVAFTQYGPQTPNPGWNQIGSSFGTTWSYDTVTCAYTVATSSSSAISPFSTPGGMSRIYAISGADTSNPISGGITGRSSGGAWSWQGPTTVPAISNPSALESSGSAYFLGTKYSGYGFNTPWLTVPDNTGQQYGTGDFTTEFWWNPINISSYQSPIDKGYNNAGSWLLQTGYGDGKLVFWGNGSALVASSIAVTANQWNHVAVCRSGTNLTIYINGVSAGTASGNSTNFNSSASVYIGSGSGTYAAGGYISNVRMVKGTALYTSNFTPPSSLTAVSGTALLTCQNSSGTITDASSNNSTITNGGGVYPTTNSPGSSGGLRLTFFAGYGGGGNGWNNSDLATTWGGPDITRVVSTQYYSFYEGGGSGAMQVIYAPGYPGGASVYATVSLNQAKTSGFFSMF